MESGSAIRGGPNVRAVNREVVQSAMNASAAVFPLLDGRASLWSGRMGQAALSPSPSLDFSQGSGVLTSNRQKSKPRQRLTGSLRLTSRKTGCFSDVYPDCTRPAL